MRASGLCRTASALRGDGPASLLSAIIARTDKEAAMTDTAEIEFDQQSQLDQVKPFILPTERLFAVFDCKGGGTGFVAVTNKRLLFYDKAFMGKRKALVSVPYGNVTSVGSVDQGRGLWGSSSELVLTAGAQTYEFEFRGGEKAQRAYQHIMRELLQREPA